MDARLRPHELVLGSDAVGRDLRSVAHVRHAVGDFLDHEGVADAREDVLLVVSELVTNSLMHTDGAPGVVVRHVANPERIDIEISDRSSTPPVPRTIGVGALGGRGLTIVDRLSSAWGVRPVREGKTTWATVPVHAHRAS